MAIHITETGIHFIRRERVNNHLDMVFALVLNPGIVEFDGPDIPVPVPLKQLCVVYFSRLSDRPPRIAVSCKLHGNPLRLQETIPDRVAEIKGKRYGVALLRYQSRSMPMRSFATPGIEQSTLIARREFVLLPPVEGSCGGVPANQAETRRKIGIDGRPAPVCSQ